MQLLESLWRSVRGLPDLYGGWRIPLRLGPEIDATLDGAFVLGLLRVELPKAIPHTTENAAAATEDVETRARGLPVACLSISANSTSCSTLAIGRMLERVLCASGCAVEQCAVLESVKICNGYCDAAGFARVCSSVVETQRTSTLTLELGPVELGHIPISQERNGILGSGSAWPTHSFPPMRALARRSRTSLSLRSTSVKQTPMPSERSSRRQIRRGHSMGRTRTALLSVKTRPKHCRLGC